MLGISKRELLSDYYPDELPAIFAAWSALHGAPCGAEAETVSAAEFLGM